MAMNKTKTTHINFAIGNILLVYNFLLQRLSTVRLLIPIPIFVFVFVDQGQRPVHFVFGVGFSRGQAFVWAVPDLDVIDSFALHILDCCISVPVRLLRVRRGVKKEVFDVP